MDHPTQQNFYQTGDTQPPKNYRVIISLLLVVIVILGSVVTILSLLNIRLTQKLSMQSETAIPVQLAALAEEQQSDENTNILGFSAKTLSVFDQKFYHLPQGVYITDVTPGSSADKQGVLPGDILIAIQNTPVTEAQALEDYLRNCTSGQTVKLVFFRDGKQRTAHLTVN